MRSYDWCLMAIHQIMCAQSHSFKKVPIWYPIFGPNFVIYHSKPMNDRSSSNHVHLRLSLNLFRSLFTDYLAIDFHHILTQNFPIYLMFQNYLIFSLCLKFLSIQKVFNDLFIFIISFELLRDFQSLVFDQFYFTIVSFLSSKFNLYYSVWNWFSRF